MCYQDYIIIPVYHQGVEEALALLKGQFSELEIIAGNLPTRIKWEDSPFEQSPDISVISEVTLPANIVKEVSV